MLGNKNIEERVKKAINRKRKEGKNEEVEIETAQYSLKLI